MPSIHFNPRTRVGCDQRGYVMGYADAIFQSTHPGGVRLRMTGYTLSCRPFQSTHPGGVRPHMYSEINGYPTFQSTHPGGVRHCLHCRGYHLAYFNPRTRVGCDSIIVYRSRLTVDFNPRTRVGCDCSPPHQRGQHAISIHAPGWGATGKKPCTCILILNFNPRTRVGCDLFSFGGVLENDDFNPRTRVGCDFATVVWDASTFVFQSTHPGGVRL